LTVEKERIKFNDQKRPMKIDGYPFHMNMIGGSTTLIKIYQKKREREARAD
jgi:hypothetical protein